MKARIAIASAFAALFVPGAAFAASLSISPEKPIQGEPVMIRIEDAGTTTAKSISFDGKELGIFAHKGAPAALYGIDLNQKVGAYKVQATLSDGTILERSVLVAPRKRVEVPLGIPQKLGGNTATSVSALVSTLAAENASLLGLRTGAHAFWREPFRYPVKDPVVTDEYGYSRQTVGQSIAHRGTDFRAKEGTPVLAMNRGVVRVAREGRNYGKTIVVDHGLGVQTLYMHLSKINVNVGELVLPGQTIGFSGSTGYAEAPHLHLSVRIREVSIDPMVFLGFFK